MPSDDLTLDMKNWEVTKGKQVMIKAGETLFVDSQLADGELCYVYYKAKPHGFDNVPTTTQLAISADKEYVITASGEKEEKSQITLVVVAYSKNKKEEVYFIPLNEKKIIKFESYVEKVIFCLRMEGPGKIIIREIQIQRINQLIEKSNPQSYGSSTCNRPDIKVACILDNFSYECFNYECSLIQLDFRTWKQQLNEMKYDFLFVESAWDGLNGTWRNNFNKNVLFKLVNYCKEKNLPTVYWGKDDPSDYKHFIEIAKLFDYIFTTDENCIPRYKNDIGHDRVYLLPFAAQPKLHNPIESNNQNKNNVAFAGSWYGNKFPDRNEDLKMMLNAAKEFGLEIYDRHYSSKSAFFKFPDEYRKYIIGTLDYNDMIKAYKLYKIFLNVNSVQDSPTMFSRRVFEILASGTVVLSSYSKAIEKTFEEIVPICLSEKDTKEHLSSLLNNPEYTRRLGLKGLREIHLKHLYKHRFNSILEKIGFKTEMEQEGISIIVSTKRPLFVDNIIENYLKQDWGVKELIVILNNDEIDINSWKAKTHQCPNLSVYQLSEQISLGECLNFAVKKATYNFVAKFDDDDYYGPYFLMDLMHAFNYTDADIVGKLCHYAYLESMKALVVRFLEYENKFTDFLVGSFIVKKETFNQVNFDNVSIGEISKFLKKCSAKGYKIYSADRYNYVYIRSVDPNDHSWKRTDNQLLGEDKCSIIAFTDDYKTHVTV